ncbi:hypothetical protein MBLNU459_g0887t1 [Dothideomycetes sp. NU459]
MPTFSAAPSAATKRPKLSLNTTSLPTSSGKSTTGLRLETLSVASPTSKNTFNNAYGHAATPGSTASPLSRPPLSVEPTRAPTHRSQAPKPLRTSSSDSIVSSASSTSAASGISASSSASSASSASFPLPPPYRLPFNNTSILTNGPLPRVRRKKSFTTTRPMFPSPKRVSFRAPLTEEIQTETYTLAHSDLDSSWTISTLNSTHPQRDTIHPSKPTETSRSLQQDKSENGDLDAKSDPKSPHIGDKRESSDEEEDSDVCPATPVTRRSKRPREWVWTLGPIEPCSIPQKEAISNPLAAGKS